MDAIKGTMTEIYNDLSKSTTGNTVAEVGLIDTHISFDGFVKFFATLYTAEYSFVFPYSQIIVIVLH